MTAAAPPPRISAAWLAAPERARVFEALAAKGHVARAVGGAVRNTLLGVHVSPDDDVDVATTATPKQVIEAARAAGLKALPTGISHGTVTVVAGHVRTEVTTLRRDVESHGRHATVAFTDDWAEDAARRDFTMNALYCDADGALFDPLGGYADLMARRVRFIGDPHQRIREDYLRILRFFRFNAQHGRGPVDEAGLAACVALRDGLARLSGERIAQEMQRLLPAPRGVEIAGVMFAYGLLVQVLGRAAALGNLARLTEVEKGLGLTPDFSRRLAALAMQVEDDAAFLQVRLKLSNAVTARIVGYITAPSWPDAPAERAARAYLYTHGAEAYRDALVAAQARGGAAMTEAWRAAYNLPDRWQPPRFLLTGADAQVAGLSGPAIGAALRTAEAAWIDSDFTTSREELLELLKGTTL